jgi:hypothetical protein
MTNDVRGAESNLARSASPRRGSTRAEGFVVWFTGLSGAGKSTITEALAADLRAAGRKVEVLDEVVDVLGVGELGQVGSGHDVPQTLVGVPSAWPWASR